MHLKPTKVIVHEESPFGLGDAVESIAKPIAKAIDFITGSKLVNCKGCPERKESLNNHTRDIRHPFRNRL